MLPHASTRRFWESRATSLACRINFGAWLARVTPAAFAVATGFAVLVYALRRMAAPLGWTWLGLVGALGAVGAVCWWHVRRSFYTPCDARVLLEAHLKLDARLTAADLGLVAWPAAPLEMPAVLRWRLQGPLAWIVGAAALLAVATWAPTPREIHAAAPTGSPPALLQTQDMLAALKQLDVAEPQALQNLEDRARELARRPSEEQYSHSALEAADALRDQTAVSAAALSRAMEAAANALREADDSEMAAAAGRLAAALTGLRDGLLPANRSLLAQLPASASELAQLSAAQRAQLAQQLANAAKGLRGIGGAAGAGAQVAQPDGEDTLGGGLGGGGEAAPLMLARQQSDAGEGNAEGLSAGDIKRFALGDKLGTTTGTHDVDPARAVGPMQAGAIAAPAAGGEAVWVNRLTPAERAALKNFFK